MPDNQEYFKELLKRNGLKVTTQRVAVLDVLKAHPEEHMTAEQIYDKVKKQFNDIGLATVYRTIQLLSELNLIDKLNLDDGCVRYEIGRQVSNGEQVHHHHHLICVECGLVSSFEDDLLEKLEERIAKTEGFHVKDHEVKLYGYCKNCNTKYNSNSAKVKH